MSTKKLALTASLSTENGSGRLPQTECAVCKYPNCKQEEMCTGCKEWEELKTSGNLEKILDLIENPQQNN